MPNSTEQPLRADAQRSVRSILRSADTVLSRDASATLDEIARQAGVARSTLHRRFASREDLLASLTRWSTSEIKAALGPTEQQHIPTRPALQAATEQVLRVKVAWPFTSTLSASIDPQAQDTHIEIANTCHALLRSAQDHGVLDQETDLAWARQVYYALVEATVREARPDDDPATLATRLIQTFLNGLAPQT